MRCITALLPLFLAVPAFAQAPRVVSVSPASEAVAAPTDAAVVVEFDRAVDRASLYDGFRVFGAVSGPVHGPLSFEDADRRVRFEPERPFAAGERVRVQLARMIAAADGAPMERGYAWFFWAASAPAEMTFGDGETASTRRDNEAPVGSTAAYAYLAPLGSAPVPAVAVANETAADVRVLVNGGGGLESPDVYALPVRTRPGPIAGGDLNGDGSLDLAVPDRDSPSLYVLLGRAFDLAPAVAYPTGGTTVYSVALGDFDGDGRDDAVTASRTGGVLSLLRGRGDGSFEAPVTFESMGLSETAVATVDANGDGLLDVFIADLAGGVNTCLGDGDGGFTCFAQQGLPSGAPWAVVPGDLDGDGDPDAVVARSSGGVVEVLYGDGAGRFEREAFHPAGAFTVAVALGDLDGDGDLDAVASNEDSGDFAVFENELGGLGLSQRIPAPGVGSFALLHDRDGDGALDVTGLDGVSDLLLLFERTDDSGGGPEPPEEDFALTPLGNPFRGTTAFRIGVPYLTAVRLAVYDVLGREVALLLDEPLEAGAYRVPWDAGRLPAGSYLVQLAIRGLAVTERIVLVR